MEDSHAPSRILLVTEPGYTQHGLIAMLGGLPEACLAGVTSAEQALNITLSISPDLILVNLGEGVEPIRIIQLIHQIISAGIKTKLIVTYNENFDITLVGGIEAAVLPKAFHANDLGNAILKLSRSNSASVMNSF